MRVGVLSDVHGNRHAFEAVLDDVDETGVDAVWCLGDLVGYGADPDACVDIAASHTDLCLGGNHDLAVRGDLALEEFSAAAAAAARWTRDVIAADTMEFLVGLPTSDVSGAVGLFHASPRDPVWEYVLSDLQADLCLDAQRHRVCFVGHSHVALAFHRRAGEPARGEPCRDGTRADLGDGEWLVNPGSVGQPRDGDPRAAWLLLDLAAWSAEWRRVPYDVGAAGAAIRRAGLPASLAERLRHGQ